MYSVHDHGSMLADRVRVAAYRRALEQVVKPGDVVAEIGTGAGLLAVFACQFGARRVYAMECDEIIELARQVARDNGCEDRIEFIRGLSTYIQLPEKANVIVADIHGGLPVYKAAPAALIDARLRFLAPGGTMIPLRERIWIAAVELTSGEYDEVAVWSDGRWGVDLSAGRRFGVDCPFSARVEPEAFLTEPVCLDTLDYMTMESPAVCGRVNLRATRNGQANGYSLWFDSDLTERVNLSTAPGKPATVYPNQFAPWTRPVGVEQGGSLDADIRFLHAGDDYVWTWNTTVRTADGKLQEQFHQSNLGSIFVTPRSLQKRAPGYRPALKENGAAVQTILGLMNGQRTHEQIAQTVKQRHAEAFLDEKAALRAVAEISEKYGD